LPKLNAVILEARTLSDQVRLMTLMLESAAVTLPGCAGVRVCGAQSSLAGGVDHQGLLRARVEQTGKWPMSFSAFINNNIDALVAHWEAFARTLPAGRTMSTLALRDHSREILLAVAAEMARPLGDGQRVAQSESIAATPESISTAASEHGALRQLAGFDIVHLVAEFRALRASVIAFWLASSGQASGAAAIAEVIRFNEGIDIVLAESVQRYSNEVAASRERYLAVLGHDLRGPLLGVNMSVALLAKQNLSDTVRHEAAARIKRASFEMSRLINDLLDPTRTRLGSGIPISRADCDLGAVCKEALELMRAGWPEQPFAEQLSGNLNLYADAAGVQQALSNLMSNAVQHADRSTPITLSARGEADAVLLQISSAGEPIPPHALEVIFEPVVQAPGADAQTAEHSKTSLGLGLFMVREIVLGHGGTVTVESSAATGTVFTVRLPRTPD